VSATAKWKVPSLTQFLKVGTKKEFLGLKAIKDDDETENEIDFSKLRNHLFGHPAILSPLEGRGSIPVGEAGAKIVGELNDMTKEGDNSDVEAIANFIVGSHLTLAFLWIISRGLSEPVKLEDPPESDSVDEACQNTLRRLQGKGEERPEKRSKGPHSWEPERRKAVAGATAKAPAPEIAPLPPQMIEAQDQRATTTLTAQTAPNPPQEDRQPSPNRSHSPPPHQGQERD
jgi:hypothetical protein